MYKIHDYKQESKKIYRTHKIISKIIYAIIIPIIIIDFILIIKSFINPNKIPDFFGFKNFIIVSQSMEPNIRVGDAVLVKQVDEKELEINDIISFHDGTDINTHRISDITEKDGIKLYTTKGDNNKREDKNKITFKDIEGKYIFKISNFMLIAKILKSKITLCILLILLVFSLWFNHRINKRKEERSNKRKNYEETN